MSRGFNRIIIMGNLARDPDIQQTQNSKVARFTVAVGRQWKNKQTGETQSQTDFIPVAAWAFLADVAEKYLRKGNPVLVEGRLQVREYEDKKSGGRRWATEVIAENVTLLPGGKRDEDSGRHQPRGAYERRDDTPHTPRGEDTGFEEDFPLDFSDLADEGLGDGPADVDVPF